MWVFSVNSVDPMRGMGLAAGKQSAVFSANDDSR